MGYKQNNLISKAWERYRILYKGKISPTAFLIGDTLFEYATRLSSDTTILLGNYFVFEYKKQKIAKDIGVNTDTLRKTTKGRGGNVWNELERIGFIINSKKHIKVKYKNGKNEIDHYMSTKVAIPLFVEILSEEEDLTCLGYFYKEYFGERKTLKYINNLEEKINGTYNINVIKKISTVNFTFENINNYTLFEKDSEKVKRAKLCFQFFCLLGKSGVDVQRNSEQSFQFFHMFICKCFKESQGGSFSWGDIEKLIRKVYTYPNKGEDVPSLYSQLIHLYEKEKTYELERISRYTPNVKIEDRFERIREQTEKRKLQENKTKLELLKNTLKTEPIEYHTNIIKDIKNEYYLDRFEDYHFITELNNLSLEAEKKLFTIESKISEVLYDEYLEYSDRDDLEQLLFEVN